MKEKLFAALLAPTIIAGALGIFFIVAPKDVSTPQVDTPKEPQDWMSARMACKESIKKQLHDPSSAEFPAFSEFKVIPVEEPVSYDVMVDVRAKNAFNALRLITFKCEIRELSRGERGGLNWKGNVQNIQH